MPVWYETIKLTPVWRHPDLDFKTKRDLIVASIKASFLFADSPVVQGVVPLLAQAANVEEFSALFGTVYDEADRLRVWIETIDD